MAAGQNPRRVAAADVFAARADRAIGYEHDLAAEERVGKAVADMGGGHVRLREKSPLRFPLAAKPPRLKKPLPALST